MEKVKDQYLKQGVKFLGFFNLQSIFTQAVGD